MVEKIPFIFPLSSFKLQANLKEMLKNHVPDLEMEEDLSMEGGNSRSQKLLYRRIKMSLPLDTEVEYDYLSPLVSYHETQRPMQMDIWIPRWNMCLEYQGEQHYFHKDWSDVLNRRAKDVEKMIACRMHFIDMLHVPYWWNIQDNSVFESLSSPYLDCRS
jgi:hypothetical protein